MQRDQSFGADDRFMWTIDSFLDGRSGYYFEINPSGAMGDGLVILPEAGRARLPPRSASAGRGTASGWPASATPDGWSARNRNPVSHAELDRTASAWGINFQRTVRRKGENGLWMGVAPSIRGWRACRTQAGVERARGDFAGSRVGPQTPRGRGVSSEPGLGQPSAHPSADVGIDAFYSLTPRFAPTSREHRFRRNGSGRAAREPDAVSALLRGARLLPRRIQLSSILPRGRTSP